MRVIAIDGPAASGKSAIGKALAGRLGYLFLDSGLIYRAIAFAFSQSQETEFSFFLEKFQNSLTPETLEQLLNDSKLQRDDVGQLASKIAVMADVRRYVDLLQRKWAENKNGVVVGRDIGTVVFPDAEVKFYLTASLKVRALRRWQQLESKGIDIAIEQIQEDLFLRDERDRCRQHAPLQIPPDAIIIDNSDLSINQTVDLMIKEINN